MFYNNNCYSSLFFRGDIMPFSKINYNSGEEVFNIKIEDNTGSIKEKWKFMRRDFPKWVNIMCKKFGFNIKVKEPTDLDWTNY